MKNIKDSLIKLGIDGLNKGILIDGENLKYFFSIRDSFFHRLDCIILTQNHLKRLMSELGKYLNENPNAVAPTRESIDLMRALALETTYFLENFIFHLLSSMEHLKDIVSLFYKDINLSKTLRKTLYIQVLGNKQERFKDKEILKFVKNNKYNWLITSCGKKGFYQYRANIYHNLSKLCDVGLNFTYNAEDKTSSTTSKIGVPQKLWEIRQDLKKDNLVDFMDNIIKDYIEYISNLIKVINRDNGLSN